MTRYRRPQDSVETRHRGPNDGRKKRMKAIVLSDGGPAPGDLPVPKPKPNEVLVRVRACSLNRADLIVTSGRKHGDQGGPGAIPGLEWSGEVVETGAEVPPTVKPGDRVMCTGSGGYAEYAVTDWGRVAPISTAMSFEEAATLPLALQTMGASGSWGCLR